jgi:hypothetical protein
MTTLLRTNVACLAVGLLVPAITSCPEPGEPSGSSASSGMATEADPPPADGAEDSAADSTGASLDPACLDDYHGNQAHASAIELALEGTRATTMVLGDGIVADLPEVGSDELVVCSEVPTDFFALTAACPGYVSIEARELEGEVPDLLLYDSVQQDALPVERVLGNWYGFFLKPIQRRLDGDAVLLEVRHAGGGPQRYSLTVTWLPEDPGQS